MAGNSFGNIFRLTTFGESHGPGIGGIIDGCPAGLTLDTVRIASEMERRRPGQSSITTSRREADAVEFLSGIYQGKTTGTPMAFLVRNFDYQPSDYDQLATAYRPSHADFTYDRKYGIRDPRGGGRASARETAARVVGGAVARQLLETLCAKAGRPRPTIQAYVSQVGEISLEQDYRQLDLAATDDSPVRCPHADTAQRMLELIEAVKKDGDTVGGVISCVARDLPAGLGEPVFDKLQAALGRALLSINAAHGFDYGSGFAAAKMRGSEHNDRFVTRGDSIVTETNRSGGIQGGISNGMDICFRVAFKPVSTLMQPQATVDSGGREITLDAKGRHDPCVVPRAVPIVEAMTALVLADFFMMNLHSKI